MHLIFRTMLILWRANRFARRHERHDPTAVASIRLRTLPTDIDLNGHMNNGVYLSVFDLGRFDQMIRSGVWQPLRERGWFPVVVAETITFRKSLPLWKRFTIETKIIGFDEKAALVEQRVVVRGEVYTTAIIRARFLSKSGGTVSTPDLMAAAGLSFDDFPPLPDWIADWAEHTALPSTRVPTPSVWPGAKRT